MTPFNKYYLKYFIYIFLSYLLLGYLLDLPWHTTFQSPLHTVLKALLFSVVLTLLAIAIHKSNLNSKGLKPRDVKEMTVKYTEEFIVMFALADVKFRLTTDLPQALGVKRIKIEKDGLLFTVNTRITMRSWGERVIINLEPVSDHETLLIMLSKPILTSTIADNGKNKENIDNVKRIFTSHLFG